jgi:putative SOS response-associated peptidase YedK
LSFSLLRQVHQVEADPGSHLVYGFTTIAPIAVVMPIHPKAMPVLLTRHEIHGRSLDADPEVPARKIVELASQFQAHV